MRKEARTPESAFRFRRLPVGDLVAFSGRQVTGTRNLFESAAHVGRQISQKLMLTLVACENSSLTANKIRSENASKLMSP